MHATPKSALASTVAIDLAKDVFELAFADSDARIVERRRLTRTAFALVQHPFCKNACNSSLGRRVYGLKVR